MIKSFTVTNYLGDSIKLSLAEPEKTGFAILSVTGLNPPKANINTTDMASVDGSLYNSARLDKRNIVFTILFVESDTGSIEDIRHKSYKYFPLKKVFRQTETPSRRLASSAPPDGFVSLCL